VLKRRKEKEKLKGKLVTGLTLTVLLVTMIFSAIPVRGLQNEIVIGLVGPKGWIQWDGIKEGALLAKDHVGAINIGGTDYTLRFVEIDSHAVPTPDPAAGIQELLSALAAEPNMQYLLGGFRTECIAPMEEACMDYAAANGRPIWIICGAATDSLIQPVVTNYARYKYMFRATPMASAVLLSQILMMVRGNLMPDVGGSTMGLIGTWPQEWAVANDTFGFPQESFTGPGRLAKMYGNPAANALPGWPLPLAADGCLGGVKVWVMAENLVWCDAMAAVLVGNVGFPEIYPGVPNPYPPPPDPRSALGPYASLAGVGFSRPSAVETNFGPFIAAAEAAGAHLIIPIFSAVAGASYTVSYGTLKPKAFSFGINVESQANEYWVSTGGLCAYESSLMSLGTQSVINPYPNALTGKRTTDVWADYVAKFGHGPVYTMWGVYDAIVGMAEDLPGLGSWPVSTATLIARQEATSRNGILGYFKYTDNPVGTGNGKGHDVYTDKYCNTPFWPPLNPLGTVGTVRSHIPQWQNGRMEVIWPRAYGPAGPNLPSARATKIPSWMYSLADTDLYLDGTIDGFDMGSVGQFWQKTPAWYLLEADMDGNVFINIFDIARVAKDFGTTVSLPLP